MDVVLSQWIQHHHISAYFICKYPHACRVYLRLCKNSVDVLAPRYLYHLPNGARTHMTAVPFKGQLFQTKCPGVVSPGGMGDEKITAFFCVLIFHVSIRLTPPGIPLAH